MKSKAKEEIPPPEDALVAPATDSQRSGLEPGSQIVTAEPDHRWIAPWEELDPGKGAEMELDAGTFNIMRGRDKKDTNNRKVKGIELAIKRGEAIPRVPVYEEETSGERFAPDGAHRSAAYQKLKMKVPVIVNKMLNARERAEWDSCRVNATHGHHRSRADLEYQADKAYKLLSGPGERIPSTSELAQATQASPSFCRRFIIERAWTEDPPANDADAANSEPVAAVDSNPKLAGKLKDLKEALKAPGITFGEATLKDLMELDGRVRELLNPSTPAPATDISGAKIKEFMDANGLNSADLRRLLDVDRSTVSRWLKGRSINTHHRLVIRNALRLTPEQVRTLLEKLHGE